MVGSGPEVPCKQKHSAVSSHAQGGEASGLLPTDLRCVSLVKPETEQKLNPPNRSPPPWPPTVRPTTSTPKGLVRVTLGFLTACRSAVKMTAKISRPRVLPRNRLTCRDGACLAGAGCRVRGAPFAQRPCPVQNVTCRDGLGGDADTVLWVLSAPLGSRLCSGRGRSPLSGAGSRRLRVHL